MNKLKKTLIVFASAITFSVAVIIIFISPITKYLLEKHDTDFLGRQIKMDWVYANPFTGYVYIDNLKIYELNSDSVFVSAKSLSGHITTRKIILNNFDIHNLVAENPKFYIIKVDSSVNFKDLIEKFSTKKSSKASQERIRVDFPSLKINNGEFYFLDKQIPVNYFIKNVAFQSTEKSKEVDTVSMKFSFIPGIGSGNAKGNFTLNIQNLDYRIAAVINKFDLQIIDQYLKDLTNDGKFRAKFDANIKAIGNFNDQENITAKGMLAINEFHFGKSFNDNLAAFNKLTVIIDELSPKKRKYLFDSVILNRPYFKYEQYDYLDNLQIMFGKDMSKMTAVSSNRGKFNLVIEIANYVKVLSRNFFRSNYNINKLAIDKGNLQFNDFSISEKFSANLSPITVSADSINKKFERVKLYFKSGIKPFGNGNIVLSINPKDSTDFDLQYQFQKIPASIFNPYTISYSSFPLDKGTIELNGKWNVRNGIIRSENHLLIIDPRTSKRVRNKDTKWLPVPLILGFIRERGNVIDYDIPITGNLKNPKFHLKDVIIDLLKNIFIKPPTTLYGLQIKNTETEIEKSLTLKWNMRQNSLQGNQEKFIEKIVTFLKQNKESFINIYPQQYEVKEKEYILFFEAKKKYFLSINKLNAQTLSEDDSIKIDKMSVKDSSFVRYLDKRFKKNTVFTLQEKCAKFINSATINTKFAQLNKARVSAFMLYFKNAGLEKRVNIYPGKNVIPYNGFSYFKIEYKGEFPKKLIKAYQKMNKLNDKAPRKKFKKELKDNARKSIN